MSSKIKIFEMITIRNHSLSNKGLPKYTIFVSQGHLVDPVTCYQDSYF